MSRRVCRAKKSFLSPLPPRPPPAQDGNPFAPLLSTLIDSLPPPLGPPRLARLFIRFRRSSTVFSATHSVAEWARLASIAKSLRDELAAEADRRRKGAEVGWERYDDAGKALAETFGKVEQKVNDSPRKKRKSDVVETNGLPTADEEEGARLRKSPTIYRDRHPAFLPPPAATATAAPTSSRLLDDAARIYSVLDRPSTTIRRYVRDLAVAVREDLSSADETRRKSLEELEGAAVTEGGSVRPEIWSQVRRRLSELSAPLLKGRPSHLDDATDGDARGLLEGLAGLVDALAPLCAPARDDLMLSTRAAITSALASSSPDPPHATLASAVRQVFQAVLTMRADLDAFNASAFGSLDEGELLEGLRDMAIDRERRGVLELVGDPVRVVEATQAWLDGRAFVSALVDVVFSNTAVSKPTLGAGGLPPTLWIHAAKLFRLQNQIQVAVTVAALSALVGASASEASTARLAALLDSAAGRADDPHATVLSDIVAEVSRTRKDVSEAEVKRILRYEDPVWTLLRNRLRSAIADSLAPSTVAEPLTLRTGRRVGSGRVGGEGPEGPGGSSVDVATVKGFENAMARLQNRGIALRLYEVKEWAREAWPDAL